jgi:hypothetical protein
LKNARLAIRHTGNKTVYESAIPCQELGWETPEPLKVSGFSFVVMNSNDGTTAYDWLNLTRGICAGKDPSLYDAFVLQAD